MIRLVLALENLLFPLAGLGVLAAFALSPRRRVLLKLGGELGERFGRLPAEKLSRLRGRPVLWVHAASAGEVAAAAGLLERLRRLPKPPAVIMTCTTAAGREKAAGLQCVDCAVMAPLDFWPPVSRFLDAARPRALVIVETELWPHMIELSRRGGLRVGLVNGRLTERSFSRYRLFRPLVLPFLARLERLAVQTEEDARRFIALGATPAQVAVVGNMKYDRPGAAQDSRTAALAVRRLGWEDSPLFVAGSTHPGEEEMVRDAYLGAKGSCPALKLVIAPRHVERAAQTERSLKDKGLAVRSWSGGLGPGADALLLDALGILPQFYGRAAVSFVGGTLVPVGGHNLLEPALAGSPVLFGPHTFHTADAARLLESAGCGFCAQDGQRLEALLRELVLDPGRSAALGALARKTAQGLQGATERTFSHLEEVLEAVRG